MEQLYGGIDLHGNNNFIVVTDDHDRIKLEKRIPNDLEVVLHTLSPYEHKLFGLVVESTYNWYWLVDGLMENGYKVHLANTNAIQQYKGLKHSDDRSDARWLAQMLRLGILPEGYVYPKQNRGVRDLLRKRMRLVQHRTAHILSIKGILARHLGRNFSSNHIANLMGGDELDSLLKDPCVTLAAKSSLSIVRSLNLEIHRIEKVAQSLVKLRPEYKGLLSVTGIGPIIASVISLETGDIRRFENVGNFSSYCRCVQSKRLSNKKNKGEGNRKNGNKYLSWAFMEAAEYSRRYSEFARRYYQRKAAKTKPVIARKALAHKLARACYFIMREQELFDEKRVFC
jgi:transposase